MKELGKIQKIAIASLGLIALAVPVAFAQLKSTNQDKPQMSREDGERGPGRRGWGERGDHRGDEMGGMMMKSLNLTDAQKAQMKQIRESFETRNKPLMEELRAKHEALREAGDGATFDETAATQRLTDMAGLEARLMGERFKLNQEMLAILTPEQKTQLEQKKAEFKAKRAERGARQGQ